MDYDIKKGKAMLGCKRKYVIFFSLGVGMAVFGAAMFPIVDYVIREEIKKKVIISNTSELYDVWQDIPIPVYMQYWMFNVENRQEILNGKKPFLTQRGPYTYRERRVKFDIVWNENGTVTYRQNRTWHFVREMSVGPDSDMIHTINPLMAVVAQAIQWLPSSVRVIVSTFIKASGADGIFTYRNVSELLWGYDDPTLVMLSKIIPLWFNETQIGFFIRKNYTDDGVYTVETGERDITKLGEIDGYNGKKYINIWTTKWANMVNGTDGSVGPPFRFDAIDSPIFISDLCRSIRGVYKEHVESPQGITLRRFAGDRFDMANATVNPDNIGFCTPQTKCLPTGLLNSTLCQLPVDKFMIPLIFSFPHFLYADPEVQNSVYGLSPNEKEHETTVDVEPWTGLVMQIAKRVQINFYVEKIPEVMQTHKMRKLFFPIVWLNESVVVDNKHASMIQDQLFLPMNIMLGVKITFLSLGGLFILIALSLFLYRRHLLKEVTISGKSLESNGPLAAYDDPDPNYNPPVGAKDSKQYDDDDELLMNHNDFHDEDNLLNPASGN